MAIKKTIFLILFSIILITATKGQNSSDILSDFKTDLQDALERNDSLNAARNYYKIAKYFFQTQDIHKSNSNLIKGIELAKGIQNHKAISTLSNYLGTNYSSLGLLDSAIFYYKVALKSSEIISDSSRLEKILSNIGDDYKNLGQYKSALTYSLKAIKIKEASCDSSNLVYYYQKHGEIFKGTGALEKWEEYIHKAYQLFPLPHCSDYKSRSAVYNDLGGIAEKKLNFQEALAYYDTLEQIGKDQDYSVAIATANNNKAIIYHQQGLMDKALESAQVAQDYGAIEDTYKRIFRLNLLAELYMGKAEYKTSKTYAEEALASKLIHNYPEEQKRAFKVLYRTEKKSGHYLEALHWHEAYKALSDSLRDKDVQSFIMEKELSYQTKKKEQTIKLLTSENLLKNERINFFIVSSIALILSIFFGVLFFIYRRRQNVQKQENLKQKLLRSQMNPHFLFNALGSIQNYMLKNETKKAAGFLNNFAALTRSILEHTSVDHISLYEEIKLLKNYMTLEQMRMNNSFDFEIIYDKNLETEFINIPPLMLQPFIENSIKHGINDLNYRGKIYIQIEEHAQKLQFIIADNGIGISKRLEQNEVKSIDNQHRSLSMKIFKERQKILSKKMKQAITFTIKDISTFDESKTGTKVIIEFPLKL